MLLRDNVFEHGSFAERIARHGGRGPAFGENLAWGTGRLASARSIVDAWMRAPVTARTCFAPAGTGSASAP